MRTGGGSGRWSAVVYYAFVDRSTVTAAVAGRTGVVVPGGGSDRRGCCGALRLCGPLHGDRC